MNITSIKQRSLKQKKSEWESIRNVIPQIEKYLNLENIFKDEKYESECPDFIFYNNTKSIGVEVTECHPSVQINKKRNAPVMKSLKDRICQSFLKNEFLSLITKQIKLNIIVDSGIGLNWKTKAEDACKSLENHLKAWLYRKECDDVYLISSISVYKTKGKNIVQFNCAARRNPIDYENLLQSISYKENKIDSYEKNSTCNEYWLCIYLPFEENRHSNIILSDTEKENELDRIIKQSRFDRIVLTSVMPNDICWLK